MNQKDFKSIVNIMGCTEALMPDPKYVVSDQEIIRRITSLDDIYAVDRGGRSLLINASFYGRLAVVSYLIMQGSDINACDKLGFTSLHCAAQNGHAKVLHKLIAAGADVNAINSLGNNALMLCTHNTPIEVFEVLLQNGCNPYLKNKVGKTACDKFSAYTWITTLFTSNA